MKALYFFTLLFICLLATAAPLRAQAPIDAHAIEEAVGALTERHGVSEANRISKGVGQLAAAWTTGDGTAEEFGAFCREKFLSGGELSDNFFRIQALLSYMNGRVNELRDMVNEPGRFTDTAPLCVDGFLASALPVVDMDAGKLSHFIRLNFPYYTDREKSDNMFAWDREKWAMVRLGDFMRPSDGGGPSPFADEAAAFKSHMERYFFRMDAVTDSRGRLLFPPETLLHSHRGLRDAIKDEYTSGDGFVRQEVMNAVVERVVAGEVPRLFLSDSTTRWNPFANKLYRADGKGRIREIKDFETEGSHRYGGFLASASNKMAYDGAGGNTVMERTFGEGSLSFENTEKLIRRVLSSPVLKDIGRLVEKELGRPLRPFDIWYSGFQEQSAYSSAMLDSMTRARYPTPAALEKDIPAILRRMGFPEEEAAFVGARTSVRPVVSGGYSSQAGVPGGTCLMTTMFAETGLDYKSYRVAMHELGHTVCAVYCTNGMDYFVLAGVPSPAITEGFAELFVYKNASGLGLTPYGKEERNHRLALAAMWYMFEMGGQSLVEIESWKWLYANPGATAEEVRGAVTRIAGDVWNTYFADIVGGERDRRILSIYNHFATGDLYLYNYFVSNAVMYQLHCALDGPELAGRLREICLEGATSNERWMRNALGEGISVDRLIEDAAAAVEYFRSR